MRNAARRPMPSLWCAASFSRNSWWQKRVLACRAVANTSIMLVCCWTFTEKPKLSLFAGVYDMRVRRTPGPQPTPWSAPMQVFSQRRLLDIGNASGQVFAALHRYVVDQVAEEH